MTNKSLSALESLLHKFNKDSSLFNLISEDYIQCYFTFNYFVPFILLDLPGKPENHCLIYLYLCSILFISAVCLV